jgi:hypothetical protein
MIIHPLSTRDADNVGVNIDLSLLYGYMGYIVGVLGYIISICTNKQE